MNKIFKKFTLVILILFLTFPNVNSEENKIKIGMLIPMTGENKELGEAIIAEEYELAARLRDQISALSKKSIKK